MHRIDHPTAVSVLPAPGAPGTPGYFTEGDPVGGIPATVVTKDWANTIQEEIAGVIESAGLTLDKEDTTQLAQAITAIVTGAIPPAPSAASETVAGIIKLATTALAQALADDTTALTPKKLADAFGGSNQSVAANGYQKIPGGLIIQWGFVAAVPGTGKAVTFPITFPSICVGVVGASQGSTTATAFNAYGVTTSGFTADTSSTGTADNFWIAIGY